MKKLFAALAAGVVALALGACSATQIQSAASNAAAINTAVVQSVVALCPAGQAFLTAAAAATANPDVAVAEDANGVFCAVNKAVAATMPAAASASAPVAASAPAVQ